jgi:hypothetical protein
MVKVLSFQTGLVLGVGRDQLELPWTSRLFAHG